MDFWENCNFLCLANSRRDAKAYADAFAVPDRNILYVNDPAHLLGFPKGTPLFYCGDVNHRIDYLGIRDFIDDGVEAGYLKIINLDPDKLFLEIGNPPKQMSQFEYDEWYRSQRMERTRKQHDYILDVLDDYL